MPSKYLNLPTLLIKIQDIKSIRICHENNNVIVLATADDDIRIYPGDPDYASLIEYKNKLLSENSNESDEIGIFICAHCGAPNTG
jgi:hypothetical protein